MFKYLILILFTTSINAFNFSDFDGDCRVLHSSGYGYNSFFHLPKSSINSDGSIWLNVSVIAPSNAHILLSSRNTASDRDPVYEIVLGAGKNTFSSIRKLRTSIRVSVNTPAILDRNDLKMFWIHLHGNILDVGKVGDPYPVLHLNDSDPLKVSYIAFGAWLDVTATWIYDCKNVTTNTSNRIDEEQRMNGRRRLESYLLDTYDPNMMPNVAGEIYINTSVSVRYIDLNMNKLRLITTANLNFIWRDKKLTWEPSYFDNTTTFITNYSLIWKPEFFIFNSAKQISGIDRKLSRLFIRNNGQVNFQMLTQLDTICDKQDVTYWPWDLHSCQIRIGLHPYTSPVKFYLRKNVEISKPEIVGNNWKLQEILVTVDNLTNEEKLATSNSSNVLVINFLMKRHSSSLTYIFLLPLVCSMLISLLCFILPPDCSARLQLHFISLTIYTVYLLMIFHRLPVQHLTTPIAVSLCSQLLVLVAFHSILTAFITNLAKFNDEYPPWLFVRKLLGNKSIRNLFLLPEDGCYNELVENDRQKFYNIWFIFAIFLDRIVLFISIVIVATSILTLTSA